MVGEDVGRAQHDGGQFDGSRNLIGAHRVQQGFKDVGEADQRLQPKGPGAALDRMHGPEDDVDRFRLCIAIVHELEAVLEAFQEFLAFNEEGGADFCHRVGHREPLNQPPFAGL